GGAAVHHIFPPGGVRIPSSGPPIGRFCSDRVVAIAWLSCSACATASARRWPPSRWGRLEGGDDRRYTNCDRLVTTGLARPRACRSNHSPSSTRSVERIETAVSQCGHPHRKGPQERGSAVGQGPPTVRFRIASGGAPGTRRLGCHEPLPHPHDDNMLSITYREQAA